MQHQTFSSQLLVWTLQDINEILSNGNLTIFIEVTVFGHEKTMLGSKFPEDKVSQRDNCRRQVCEDLGSMLHDEDFCDFEIKCGDKSFKCHRNVLSARSPVFKAIIKSEMRENNQLVINDIEPQVISASCCISSTLEASSTGSLPGRKPLSQLTA